VEKEADLISTDGGREDLEGLGELRVEKQVGGVES